MRIALLLLSAASAFAAGEFRSSWPAGVTRVWAGAGYWANPLQDWRISRGRLENIAAGGDRNVFLLTREVSARPERLNLSVRLGRLDGAAGGEGYAGFRIGIRGYFKDYRDSAVRGSGLNAGITGDGRLFIGQAEAGAPHVTDQRDLELRLQAVPSAASYDLRLSAHSGANEIASVSKRVSAAWLSGGVALVSSSGALPRPLKEPDMHELEQNRPGQARGGALRFWFRDWVVSGPKVDVHEERAFGPILFAMHTLSRGILKLTAQLAPVDAGGEVILETQTPDGRWTRAASAPVDPMSRTATFRIAGWQDTRDVPYRVVYLGQAFTGTVRKDPRTEPRIVIAAFTGNNDFGFPHADIVRNVRHFRPDLLAFTGDNIYERVGDYGTQREPLDMAALDYLRKWYLFGWEYRDLLRDTPAVAIPDDHDVYHGNLWGAAGRRSWGSGYEGQDRGGYVMPAAWVNMVQRTQTSNLPDPVDPAPVEQGIGVYFTDLLCGGVSFAVLEDRKWKSAPKEMVPAAQIVNGWPQNPDYDAAKQGDVPGAELLGRRQENFLDRWATDWRGGAWIKVVISQTLFADVATLPKGVNTDAITPKLKIMAPGEYAEGEAPVMDHDSNGWPQTPRNRALRAMRKGLAFHIAGDQHLGSTIQYGIDAWNDAGWAICVPSVANVWPRRWYPPEPGRNRRPGAPPYTGEFVDGFGNKITVHAVSNPTRVDADPPALHSRAPGYGIITLDRATHDITVANWPRWVNAAGPGAKPYEGWPITIHQTQNGIPDRGWNLPPVSASEIPNPVAELKTQAGDVIYTLRLRESTFRAPVPGPGTYQVRLYDPDSNREQTFRGLAARKRE